jgi:hypothetical protein
MYKTPFKETRAFELPIAYGTWIKAYILWSRGYLLGLDLGFSKEVPLQICIGFGSSLGRGYTFQVLGIDSRFTV